MPRFDYHNIVSTILTTFMHKYLRFHSLRMR